MNRRRGWWAWVPVALLTGLLLAGCSRSATPRDALALPDPAAGELRLQGRAIRLGTLAIDRDVEIAADGRVREVRQIQATERFAEVYREHGEALRQSMRSGWRIRTADQYGGFVVTLEQEFQDFDSFNRQRAGVITVEDHPLYDKVTYQDAVEGVGPALLERYPGPEGVGKEDWSRFLQQAVRYRYRITFPKKVTGHNMDRAAGGTAEWTRSAGEVGSGPLVLKVESKVYRATAVYVSAGVILVLIGAVVAVRLTRRWWDPEAAEQ